MFDWFRRRKTKSLKEHLSGTKLIKVSGVLFHIRKISVLDYMEGAKVLHEVFSVYKNTEERKLDDQMIRNVKKAKAYMRDVIMAGVVKPKLVRKQEEDKDAVFIEDLFDDWVMAQELTTEILQFTYSKKK
jgi:hypothetical protein